MSDKPSKPSKPSLVEVRAESEKWAPLKTNYRSGGQHEENQAYTHKKYKCAGIKLHKVSRRTT